MHDARTDRHPPPWGERSRYDLLLTLDLAGWVWEALRRRPGGGRRVLSLRRGRLLRRSPPIRLIETTAADDPETWGWRFL